jgi:hypothetical protein
MTRTQIEQGFAAIERAALNGERCPTNHKGTENPNGTLPSGITTALLKEGKIRIEVYPHNYRVIEILVGSNAGKRTKGPPNKKWRPYLVLPRSTAVPALAR